MLNDVMRDILIADFFDVEETTAYTDIRLTNVFDAVDDGGTDGSCDTIVIGLSDASDGGDVRLDKIMLGKIGDAFFCDDEIGFEFEDFFAQGFDLFFFYL